jgi:hypothetical protein
MKFAGWRCGKGLLAKHRDRTHMQVHAKREHVCPLYPASEGRTATKAFRKRDLPTDQAQAQQPEWDCLSGDVQVSAIRQLLGEAAV